MISRLLCSQAIEQYDAEEEYLIENPSEVTRLLATGCFTAMSVAPADKAAGKAAGKGNNKSGGKKTNGKKR